MKNFFSKTVLQNKSWAGRGYEEEKKRLREVRALENKHHDITEWDTDKFPECRGQRRSQQAAQEEAEEELSLQSPWDWLPM